MKHVLFFLFGILAGTLVFVGTLWGVSFLLDFAANGRGFWHDLLMNTAGVGIVGVRLYKFFGA